jgi:hypothetical protein
VMVVGLPGLVGEVVPHESTAPLPVEAAVEEAWGQSCGGDRAREIRGSLIPHWLGVPRDRTGCRVVAGQTTLARRWGLGPAARRSTPRLSPRRGGLDLQIDCHSPRAARHFADTSVAREAGRWQRS